jgi:hypothetical protein
MHSATAIKPHTELVFKDSVKYAIVTEFLKQHWIIWETAVVVSFLLPYSIYKTVNVAPDLKKVENPCLHVPFFPFKITDMLIYAIVISINSLLL